MKLVGVIGAGAAGLCTTRHILATSGLTPVVWEQSSDLGGTWRLSDDETEGIRSSVHSSMYQNLRTDLPKVMMAFPDFPFPEEGESFVHHTSVLKYLEDYAHHYDLLPWILFGHHVDEVYPVMKKDGPPAWAVTVTNLASGMSSTTTCDALLICNGHFTVPHVPHIDGIENYKGHQVHSCNYHEPSPYGGSRVLILGAAASGLDISLDLSSVVKEVLLSHNLPVSIPSEFPPNIHQVAGVVKATEDGFVFSDGTTALADTIMYCTGYKYEFPFLTEECGIQVENNIVKPLYKHIINSTYPSMAFIGIPSRIIAFPLINYQVQYFLANLIGRVTLPTVEEMTAISQKCYGEWKQQGLLDKHFHMMHNDQWQYMDDLAAEAGLDKPPSFLKKMWDVVITRLFFSFPTFKSYEYSLKGDGTIVETRYGKVVNTSWDIRKLVFQQLIYLVWRDFSRVMYLVGSLLFKKMKKILHLS
ncbi:LOW QUALITY PROTEIN: uncharacterized protein [Panulirus ornatus]|uniref:LOW QUALITY PROTEIN: uncharacterized protein n=1 Tax=Panulirus ornatus TaxID=150431 RepID=UPI003A836162